MAEKFFKRKAAKPAKKFHGMQASNVSKEQAYLQTRINGLLPTLLARVTKQSDGMFLFSHPTFPDLKVEGLTTSFMEEHIERALKRHFRGQSTKHVDYLFDLLNK